MNSIIIGSGIFVVRPKKLLTLQAPGMVKKVPNAMVKLTPKKTYLAFKTNYTIAGGRPSIMLVKDDVRYFPVEETYARNNFDYVSDEHINNQDKWVKTFQEENRHIRSEEHLFFELA